MASVEHPPTNGLVEKANGSLTGTFAAFVNFYQTNWDEGTPEALFCSVKSMEMAQDGQESYYETAGAQQTLR